MEARLERAAERFWAAAGGPEPFPRHLNGAVALTLPVMVVGLPRLGVFSAERWLRQRGSPLRWGERDRPLRACLVAADGSGCILLDATDTPEEQRYSLAHEVAHFLLDYQGQREEAALRLGTGALAVLDGRRLPSSSERLDAVLAGVALEAHLHFMERGQHGVERGAIAAAELRADRLALELLAPWREALAALPRAGTPAQCQAAGEQVLAAGFGLPAGIAAAYACRMLAERDGPPSWGDWLA